MKSTNFDYQTRLLEFHIINLGILIASLENLSHRINMHQNYNLQKKFSTTTTANSRGFVYLSAGVEFYTHGGQRTPFLKCHLAGTSFTSFEGALLVGQFTNRAKLAVQ